MDKTKIFLGRIGLLGMAIFLLWAATPAMAGAEKTGEADAGMQYLEEMLPDTADLKPLQKEWERLFPESHFNVTDALKQIVRGDFTGAFESLKTGVWDQLVKEFSGMKKVFFNILMIGVLSALLSALSGIFENHQVADISFYFAYLLLVVLLLTLFEQAAATAAQMIDNMLLFMKLLIPTYTLAVGVASGAATGNLYYQFLLILLYVVQTGVSVVLLPLVYCYIFINVVNGLWTEERLSMLAALLQKGIRAALKIALTAVFGMNLIQTMITPVIDSIRNTAARKAISSIPGLGNIAGGVTEMLLGSAVLIKNSMGALFILLLLGVCIIPLCKLFATAVLLKCAAAVMGMAADKRITGCTDKIGEGSLLLLQSALTAAAMFIITIAIISYTTNRGF